MEITAKELRVNSGKGVTPVERIRTILLLAIVAFSVSSGQGGKFLMVFLSIDPNRPILPQGTVDSLQTLHMANIGRLAKEGKLITAGPFDGGGGIFVFGTSSVDSARQWLSTDPAVRSKRWIVEMFPYLPRIGSICKVGELYEMTSYSFVRFQWTRGNPEAQLTTLAPQDSIVTAGLLKGSGSVLVVRGSVDEKKLIDGTKRLEGMKVTVKNLWIARGSFCER